MKQNLKDTTILGVIVGGDSLEERNRSVRETVKRPVGGFVLDGFHQGAMEDGTRWSIMESVLVRSLIVRYQVQGKNFVKLL